MGADECRQPLLPRESATAVKRAGVTCAALGFSLTLGASVWIGLWWKDVSLAPDERVRQKSYSHLVAEGVRYRDCQNLGVDRFAFKSCRVEKRRRGALTFGAFNVLAVDGLVLNIPAANPDAGGDGTHRPEAPLSPLAEGFAETFLHSQGLGIGHVSGLRITGLTVNRCYSNRIERLLEAEQAESGMAPAAGLKLRECTVYAPDGSATNVRGARLALEPAPALIYRDGGEERRIGL